jgi:hypothetical protein
MKHFEDTRVYTKTYGKHKRILKSTQILSNIDLDEIFNDFNSDQKTIFEKTEHDKKELKYAKSAYKRSKFSDSDFDNERLELAGQIATTKKIKMNINLIIN